MATITFDTHDFVKKLKGAGFSEEQAEVLTDLQKATVANTLEQGYKCPGNVTTRYIWVVLFLPTPIVCYSCLSGIKN